MMKLKCHCGMVEAEINLENFNKIGQKTYELLEDTGRHILRAIACYLELEETYFDKHIFNGNSILRALHYPPITEEPKKAERAADAIRRCWQYQPRNRQFPETGPPDLG